MRPGSGDNNGVFTRVFEKNREMVFQYACSFTRCPFTADDIVQEVFAKLWEQWSLRKQVDYIVPFLLVLTRNCCINYLRRQQRDLKGGLRYGKSLVDRIYDVEEKLYARELNRIHREAVDRLPERQKQVYRLFEEDYNYSEVVKILKLSRNTVKEHKTRARQAIRIYVGQQLEPVYGGKQKAA